MLALPVIHPSIPCVDEQEPDRSRVGPSSSPRPILFKPYPRDRLSTNSYRPPCPLPRNRSYRHLIAFPRLFLPKHWGRRTCTNRTYISAHAYAYIRLHHILRATADETSPPGSINQHFPALSSIFSTFEAPISSSTLTIIGRPRRTNWSGWCANFVTHHDSCPAQPITMKVRILDPKSFFLVPSAPPYL